ncbi:hypothetical protein [Streptomyces rubiginosohelvolus]|uniref:hypothetical protein n=1 Tax=Streptomyces rubiginosohelvolus TaxID=67362 RepID=UPI0036B7E365
MESGRARGRPTALTQVVDGPAHLLGGYLILKSEGRLSGTDMDPDLRRMVAEHAQALLRAGCTGRSTLGGDAATCPEPVAVLVRVAAPAPRLLIFGAIDFAAARFSLADEVVVHWPHRYLDSTTVDERTALCVLATTPSSASPSCAGPAACRCPCAPAPSTATPPPEHCPPQAP